MNGLAGNNNQARLDWIDLARGMAILLVVIFHGEFWLESYDLGWRPYGFIDMVFRPIRMPLFFLISGFLSASAIKRRPANIVVKRTVTLFYLYGLWNLFEWMVFWRFPMVGTSMGAGPSIIRAVSMWYRPETGLWYIWALSIYYVIARLTVQWNKPVLLIVMSVLSVIAMGKYFTSLSPIQEGVFWYLPFFMSGLWYGDGVVSVITNHRNKFMIFSLPLFLLCGILISKLDAGVVFGLLRLLICTCGVVLGCAASIVIAQFTRFSGVLRYLGKNTLPIFLCHQMLISVYAKSASELPHTVAVRILSEPVIVLASICVAMLLYNAVRVAGVTGFFELPSAMQAQLVAASDRHLPGLLRSKA
jgi:fucose 4-O-acetylase-like acetyltransferase